MTIRVLHLTTHLNTGGITNYILHLVKPIQEFGVNISVLSSGGECTPLFRKLGANTFEVPIRTKSELSPKLYFALPTVIKIIRENKINLLHAHTRVTQVMAFLIQRLTGIPVVTTCHGYYKRRIGRLLFPCWGDRAIAISLGVEDHLRNDFFIHASKARRIFNAVNLKEIDMAYAKHHVDEVKREYGFSREDCVIGIVARLVEDKGHHYLIHALAVLKNKITGLKLLIVGGGKRKKYLEETVKMLGLAPDVVFTGNVQDVTKPLAAMDIFTLPAIWREGFGLSIIEAIACKKPVIVTNIWALNTLVENGKTGILVEPKRTDQLAAAIELLVRDPRLRFDIGLHGREMVEKNFTIDRMAKEIAGLYKELLDHQFFEK